MKAVALVNQSVLQGAIKGWMERACARNGVELEFYNVTESTKDYMELFKENRNIITWNCRMPHWWTTKWRNSVLYLENSPLNQRAGIFIDSRGLYNESNLCRLRTWEQDHPVDLDAFTRRWFEWGAMQWKPRDAPILVCLQNSVDSTIQQQFPAAAKRQDKVRFFLELLYQHLPRGRRIVIRPNPRFLDDWKKVERSTAMRDDWEVNFEGKFHEILPSFSGLVTVNSTCASEAVTFGMPVATLGTGFFTGSGATLECAESPEILRSFDYWMPDHEACSRYAKAIIGRHFVPYDRTNDLPNIEMERWLARCR